MEFSPSDAILIENFHSFQIAIASGIDCFLACVNTTLHTVVKPLSDMISIEIYTSFKIAIANNSDNINCFLACVNAT